MLKRIHNDYEQKILSNSMQSILSVYVWEETLVSNIKYDVTNGHMIYYTFILTMKNKKNKQKQHM